MKYHASARIRAALAVALPLICAICVGPAEAQVTITANITGTAPSASANADVQDALSFLAGDFSSPTPFNMTADISWSDLGSGVLGGSTASSNQYQNVNNVLYIDPLDRYLFGASSTVNTGGSYSDFTIELNNTFSWDYTLGTPSNPNTVSLASVLYHEVMHSMGFAAFNNQNGTYEFNYPTLWTTHLYDATTKQAFTADTPAQRAAAMISGDADGNNGDLFFVGANEEAINGGNGVAMYAPSTFSAGSSDGSHVAGNQAGGDLMYYDLPDGVYRTPSPLILSMMQDIGWQISPAPEPSALAGLAIGFAALAACAIKARKRHVAD